MLLVLGFVWIHPIGLEVEEYCKESQLCFILFLLNTLPVVTAGVSVAVSLATCPILTG